jgi:hypothetical protein
VKPETEYQKTSNYRAEGKPEIASGREEGCAKSKPGSAHKINGHHKFSRAEKQEIHHLVFQF